MFENKLFGIVADFDATLSSDFGPRAIETIIPNQLTENFTAAALAIAHLNAGRSHERIIEYLIRTDDRRSIVSYIIGFLRADSEYFFMICYKRFEVAQWRNDAVHALMMEIVRNHAIKVAKELCQHPTYPHNLVDIHGSTPLLLSVILSDYRMAAALLSCGLSPLVIDTMGRSIGYILSRRNAWPTIEQENVNPALLELYNFLHRAGYPRRVLSLEEGREYRTGVVPEISWN